MRILIATVGSRGDVQPYVALGKGLQRAGHLVTVCTSARFKPFVVEHGLGYAYLNDDLRARERLGGLRLDQVPEHVFVVDDMRTRASTLGEWIRRDAGVGAAVSIIDRLATREPRG